MSKTAEILDEIRGLTLLEASQLVKRIEEVFGVSASLPTSVIVNPPPALSMEEQSEFTIVLAEIGANKINVIKTIREITGLGLKEAKDLVDAAPKVVKEGIGKEEAETIRKKLEAVGAKVEVK